MHKTYAMLRIPYSISKLWFVFYALPLHMLQNTVADNMPALTLSDTNAHTYTVHGTSLSKPSEL